MFTTVEPPHATIAPPTSKALLSLKVPPSIDTADTPPSQYTFCGELKENVEAEQGKGSKERTPPWSNVYGAIYSNHSADHDGQQYGFSRYGVSALCMPCSVSLGHFVQQHRCPSQKAD